MKILFLNTHDLSGGAAIAAYRLHNGLHTIGIPSQMLVQKKTGTDPDVLSTHQVFGKKYSSIRSLIDQIPVFFYRNRDPALWSPAWLPNHVAKKISALDPDIVHLHWICRGFLPVQEIKRIQKPLFWTFHDMWPMTGGCHYAGDCMKYQDRCQECPLLGSRSQTDLSSWVWKRKLNFWQDLDLTIVSPSRWLASCAKSSALFRDKSIEVIPNGIDIDQFRPVDKKTARRAFSLPPDKKLLLFGAENATSDRRKGFHHLQESLEMMNENGLLKDVEIVVFGNSGKPDLLEDKHITIHSLGKIPDSSKLPLLFSAADVFISPSVQENLSNTVMEALSCGTPVVAFDIGGMPDLIEHEKNGYLAVPYNCGDMADGINWLLEDDERYQRIAEAARSFVQDNFDIRVVARRHTELYGKRVSRA